MTHQLVGANRREILTSVSAAGLTLAFAVAPKALAADMEASALVPFSNKSSEGIACGAGCPQRASVSAAIERTASLRSLSVSMTRGMASLAALEPPAPNKCSQSCRTTYVSFVING